MRLFTLFISLTYFISFGQTASTKRNDFEKEPTVKWRFKTKQAIISSPVISDNIAYFGGLDSVLYAIDINSGATKWTLRTRGEIRSTVTIDGDKIYLIGGNGVLSCINKNSGKAIWVKAFDNTALFLAERRYDFADYYHSSPLVHDNVVYFGSGNGRVNAWKADTGELIWTYKAADIVHTKPALANGKLFFGSFDGNLYALNAENGNLLWKFKSIGQQYFPIGEMQGSPTVANNTVYIGSRDFNLYAVDADGGFCNWNRKFTYGWALPTTTRDTVVFVGTSDDRVLLALDGRDGRELWKTDVKYNIFAGCSFTDSMVYVGTIWGKVYGMDIKTGAIRWGFTTDGYKKNHDKYFKANDTFRDDIPSILKAPPEWIAAEYSMGGVFSTPAISNDMMVITTAEGVVYGLKK